NRLFLRIPIQFLALSVCAGGHDHGHGMRESVSDSRVRLISAAQTFNPVSHMREVVVADESRRDGVAPWKGNEFLGALNQGVVFAGPLLLDPFPARAPFAADVDERGGLSHDP